MTVRSWSSSGADGLLGAQVVGGEGAAMRINAWPWPSRQASPSIRWRSSTWPTPHRSRRCGIRSLVAARGALKQI